MLEKIVILKDQNVINLLKIKQLIEFINKFINDKKNKM